VVLGEAEQHGNGIAGQDTGWPASKAINRQAFSGVVRDPGIGLVNRSYHV